MELANGTRSVHSLAHGETFHPVVGPVAEAEALYVRQLRVAERARATKEEFVIWDVGLGAAANVITVLNALRGVPGATRVISFDHTLEPLRFARANAAELGYPQGWESQINALLERGSVEFDLDGRLVHWDSQLGDFPAWLASPGAAARPKPHIILYDAFSPKKNAAMWTFDAFQRLHALLDPARPCSLATYSRSTLLRVTLLLAGFFVGAGHATGEKEETTIAANTLALIHEPLDQKWLQRAGNSTSAEPLSQPVYRQARLSVENRERLARHPQFQSPLPRLGF
ncbi:MAG TPA: MnmC family methyltransferase [Verrucomicrobiae bacterium]|nr:MnmC family methyltransferase [Verrucomicrobiae bacterium]